MEKIKKIINTLIKKFMTKEVILYVVFGVLTTIVNVATFYVLTTFCHIEENISNVIAIILAVIFAYITNRKLVFNSTASNSKQIFLEMCKFFSARFFTMLVEFFGFMLLFNVLHIPNLISKLTITVLVIVLNFFLSKFFAFKNK
ncbi:MAG: GtrA family protein [Clostridia bacterium]|nr:GtrA family protein [Clostridia bacterium]